MSYYPQNQPISYIPGASIVQSQYLPVQSSVNVQNTVPVQQTYVQQSYVQQPQYITYAPQTVSRTVVQQPQVIYQQPRIVQQQPVISQRIADKPNPSTFYQRYPNRERPVENVQGITLSPSKIRQQDDKVEDHGEDLF